MSSRIQKVVFVQVALKELGAIQHLLPRLKLKPGGEVRLLLVIQAFRTDSGSVPQVCGSLLKQKTKLHSSTTINKHKEDIKEEIQKKIDLYTNCDEFEGIMKMANLLQVQFEIEVDAGLLKEVAVEYVKSFQATHLILPRQLKKELRYFMGNLSCGVSRMKSDNTVKIIRPPQENEGSALPPGLIQEMASTSGPEVISDFTCSLCKNKRPLSGLKRRFTYAELQLATNGFSSENSLADHGRKISLGILNDQRKVLIREQPPAMLKADEFKAEICSLEEIRHQNVTMFLGSCTDGPRGLLVYEFICNGSLNKHLSKKSKNLTWERRINIAYGAAKGLECLHNMKLYGGMRPSNILLTHDYQPLLSYYGFSINQYEALGQSSDTTVLKTFEYLAPEYQETGIDMSKADIFSFGVVLLELITGRKTVEDTDGQTFLRWARPLLRKKKYMELIDPTLHDAVDVHQLFWMVRVTDKCLNLNPTSRYPIKKVVKGLKDVINRCSVEDFSPTDSELMSRTPRQWDGSYQ